VAARRRRLRALGRRLARAPPPARRTRASRLVGNGRPQVAERPVRLRRRVLRASGRARRLDGRRRRVPPAGGRP
jgi:hypothetical protein